jgi:hypothetical protein
MALAHSYGATLKNNVTENEAVGFLLSQDDRFRVPTKDERKYILELLNLPPTYARAFDLLLFPTPHQGSLDEAVLKDMILVELKTTKKRLPNNPDGFFFGATENEFQLARMLGDRFRFCFVSLHEETSSHVLLTLSDLESRIKTKRIQYQINLRATSI